MLLCHNWHDRNVPPCPVFSIEIESHELSTIVPVSASHIGGMTGMCSCAPPLVEMGSHKLFAQDGLIIFLLSASWVARIAALSHCTQLFSLDDVLWRTGIINLEFSLFILHFDYYSSWYLFRQWLLRCDIKSESNKLIQGLLCSLLCIHSFNLQVCDHFEWKFYMMWGRGLS
jgi:hypothetical protein